MPQSFKPTNTSRMRRLSRGAATLIYSPESERLANQLVEYAAACSRWLCEAFQPEEPVRQCVYWMARADWGGSPATYGFPDSDGPDALLPAADVDPPVELMKCVDAMDLETGGPHVVGMAERLGLPASTVPAEVYEYLRHSPDFYLTWVAYQILPHELTHGYCDALGFTQSPRWWREGIAQWTAYQIQRELRSQEEADLVYEYYRLIWTRAGSALSTRDFASADQLGAPGLDTPTYAWYHAGLLEMYRELEKRRGAPLIPELLRAVGDRFRHREATHEEMVALFSRVVGEELRDWFRANWNLQ